jgi:hypothetical protein
VSSLAIYKFTLQLLLQSLTEHSKCLNTAVTVVIIVTTGIVPVAIILGAGIAIAAQVVIQNPY